MLDRVPSRRAGYTLIELMIVVAIVGVLAALAIPAFGAYRYRVRAAEAPTLLAEIRQRQTAYFNTYGRYCGNLDWNPSSYGDVARANTWEANANWAMLGFSPDGPVHFQYRVTVGAPGDTSSGVPGVGANGHGWFIAQARGDLDRDGNTVVFETYNDWNRVFVGDADGNPLGQGWE